MDQLYYCVARCAAIGTFITLSAITTAQIIPSERTTDWSTAGFHMEIPEPTQFLDITTFGGVGDGVTPNGPAMAQAFAASSGQMTVIEFPAGDFLFTSAISLPDSVVLRGQGAGSTELLFDLGGAGHCILFMGQELPEQYPLAQDLPRGAMAVTLGIPFPFQSGDLVRFYRNDEDLVVSPWAIGTTGQLVHIDQTGSATITLQAPLRAAYSGDGSSYLRQVVPRMFSGIECLKIERLDETVEQWSNIGFNKASHCWVRGVESNMANFSHIELFESTNCEISGNYLHHAFSYGTGGKAYGVNVFHTSGDNLIEDNIFEHLRHSMIVQIGANGNVLAYNFSTDPFWTQPPFPENAAGDLVLHGDHPYLNLFEGNIVHNIVIDDSHGSNGPFNTLFRNYAGSYGVVMSNNPPTDSVNIVGNVISSNLPLQGLYLINGTGHFQYGNIHQGNSVPQGTGDLMDETYYLDDIPDALLALGGLPQIGPNVTGAGTIPAMVRFIDNLELTDCTQGFATAVDDQKDMKMAIWPNPFYEMVHLKPGHQMVPPLQIRVMDMRGVAVMQRTTSREDVITIEGTNGLAPGCYLIEVMDREGTRFRSVVVKE